jgi:hypothetical protein
MPLQPSLMFVGNAGAYLSEAPFWCSSLGLPTKIRLTWKGLPRTNTLTYYENLQITAVKSFIVLSPGTIFTTIHYLHKLQKVRWHLIDWSFVDRLCWVRGSTGILSWLNLTFGQGSPSLAGWGGKGVAWLPFDELSVGELSVDELSVDETPIDKLSQMVPIS